MTWDFADNIQTLRLCLRLNIPVVSVYAFAIDNFNRQQEEVDALMNLARDSLAEICAEG
jgi:ditrans,polycis-polyprenyl diphosphate synthase